MIAREIHDGLNHRMSRACMMLVAGTRGKDVMKELGISNVTLCEWQRRPAFIAEAMRLRKEAYRETMGELRQLTRACVNAITTELQGGDNAAAVALKVLQMVGVDKLFEEENAADNSSSTNADDTRIAGRGRAALIDMELLRLQAEKQLLIETTATVATQPDDNEVVNADDQLDGDCTPE